jgi:hypothetical protein
MHLKSLNENFSQIQGPKFRPKRGNPKVDTWMCLGILAGAILLPWPLLTLLTLPPKLMTDPNLLAEALAPESE